MKKPAGILPAGFKLLICRAVLHQAIAVRRHGVSMMVVMTVMAAVLHLFATVTEMP
jgi:hypothetical protein